MNIFEKSLVFIIIGYLLAASFAADKKTKELQNEVSQLQRIILTLAK